MVLVSFCLGVSMYVCIRLIDIDSKSIWGTVLQRILTYNMKNRFDKEAKNINN